MQDAADGNVVIVKLSDGEDILASLEQVCRKQRIEDGAVLWGIGMVQDFEIGFFAPTGYEKRTYADRHELLAFHGSITMRSEPKFHLHVAVAQRDHSVIGGHFFHGKACMVNEIMLERFDTIRLSRKRNPKTTLNELQVE